MPVKIFVFDQIKKLMGWCPNVKTLETESRISSANFELYDQSGGEKARSPGIPSHFSRLFSRFDIRVLLPTMFLTLIYINLLFQKGINAEAFFLGFSLSLLIYLLGWKKQMHHYDSLAKKPVVGSSSKRIPKPIVNAPNAENKFVRIKFASVNELPDNRTNNGRPSSRCKRCSPET